MCGRWAYFVVAFSARFPYNQGREVLAMYENVKHVARMVAHGAGSLSIMKKRDYSRHIPMSPSKEAKATWLNLGVRMHNSMNKVVGEFAKA